MCTCRVGQGPPSTPKRGSISSGAMQPDQFAHPQHTTTTTTRASSQDNVDSDEEVHLDTAVASIREAEELELALQLVCMCSHSYFLKLPYLRVCSELLAGNTYNLLLGSVW